MTQYRKKSESAKKEENILENKIITDIRRKIEIINMKESYIQTK